MSRYLRQEASKEELEELHAWLQEPGNEVQFPGLLEEVWNDFEEKEPMQEGRAAAILSQIIAKPSSGSGQVFRPKWLRIAAAAIVILLAGAAVMTVVNHNKNKSINIELAKNDIAPGGNKAILTLANGAKIVLDSAHFGKLAQQGAMSITKTDSGKLSYSFSEKTGPMPKGAIVYNSLSTPRGGQYQLKLPDGSMVWLNAASSITYPVAFSGNERMVEITGEVYFEVVHDARMPFKVKAGKEIIEDLGTHFNINVYDDEPMLKTTLLEGSIKIQSADVDSSDSNEQEVILKPGQQAQIIKASSRQIKVVNDVNTEAVVAWKNGQFHLKGMDMGALMRQLARWYDVDVEFEGKVPDKRFGGSISRNVNLSAVLEALRDNEVQCRLEGNKIIVMP